MMRYHLLTLLLAGMVAPVLAAPAQPVGQLDVRDRVDVALDGSPAYARHEGTLLVPAGAQLLTSTPDSTMTLANGDAMVLGGGTMVDVQGTAAEPKVVVSRGEMVVAREAASSSTFQAGQFELVPADPALPMTARVAVLEDGAVSAQALTGSFNLVNREGESYPVPEGRAVRLVLGSDGKVRSLLTQDAPPEGDAGATGDGSTGDGSTDETGEEDRGDASGDEVKNMEEPDNDEGWWFWPFGGATTVVLGTGAVVGGGIAVANNNSSSGSDNNDTDVGPGFRPPASPITPPPPPQPPVEEPPPTVDCTPQPTGSVLDPRRDVFCPPDNQVRGF